LGDNEINSFKPSDYQVHTDQVKFEIQQKIHDIPIKFCSSGDDFVENSYGAIITNFELYKDVAEAKEETNIESLV
jgi:hypothetical protein